MDSPQPPRQLTTSELAREIEELEASLDESPRFDDEQEAERLAELYAERDARQRLSDRSLRPAGSRFPDDASLMR